MRMLWFFVVLVLVCGLFVFVRGSERELGLLEKSNRFTAALLESEEARAVFGISATDEDSVFL